MSSPTLAPDDHRDSRRQDHLASRTLATTDDGSTYSDEDRELHRQPLRLRFDDGHELPLEGSLTLGTSADCDIVLDDRWVSAHHAVIQRKGYRTLLRDCGSRNGTYVGGVRVEAAELRPGVPLTLGHVSLRVVADSTDDSSMIGTSVALRTLCRQLDRVSRSRASVLLLGESGTGKELAAEALHRQSGRRGAFVVLNCGAFSPELVESMLFGHERGSFTGATTRRAGVFEEADGGTLFLDEVGELPLALQPKLLRALEAGTVRAVGASGERRVDVRVVSATHRNLGQAVIQGAFRLDLFHRLANIEIQLPALRDRVEDIPLLANHFLEEITAETGPRHFGPRSLEAMLRWSWPGNIRELRNAIHRAALLSSSVLEPEDLLPCRFSDTSIPVESGPAVGRRQVRPMEDVEREAMSAALTFTNGNRRAAASALGMPKSTFCDKARRYGIGA